MLEIGNKLIDKKTKEFCTIYDNRNQELPIVIIGDAVRFVMKAVLASDLEPYDCSHSGAVDGKCAFKCSQKDTFCGCTLCQLNDPIPEGVLPKA